MDEDEKIDRQSGGRKMNDHLMFSLVADNPLASVQLPLELG